MPRSVVCLSGTMGSGLPAVARGVAEALGYRVVDEEIVLRAAADSEVEPRLLDDVESRRTFMERAMSSFGASADAAKFAFGAPAEQLVPRRPVDDALRGMIRSAVEETAQQGEVVIVAHAASHALGSRPGVLRVLVTASEATRRERLADERELDDDDAGRAMHESDAARADYLKRFYGVKAELPTHYDLVVNTDALSLDTAVALVVDAAGR